jgi:hypothetical protein
MLDDHEARHRDSLPFQARILEDQAHQQITRRDTDHTDETTD